EQQMLLQFALENGVEIPYFCYHPAMSIPTNCRMCLVEVGWHAKDRKTGELKLDENGEPIINWGRKPATACNTPLAPDMIVETGQSAARVSDMQKGVLEYMLVNHPLDCPICDQAGECPLQIWTYKYGPEGSRFESAKSHKPKRVELGPNVVLDAERCINCTRCVRFTEEISHSDQLTIVGRGDKNYPSTAPGEVFDDPYSMNTIDLCPVGALTSKDFRFKARTWEMAYSPSICTGCAKGCSVDVWTRDNEVLRLTPRDNMHVNQYWMCDVGRLDLDKYNVNRVSGAKVKGDVPIGLEDGLAKAAELLKNNVGKVYFIGSASASLESNFALRALAKKMGVGKVHYVPHTMPGWGDNMLRRDDRTANAKGCETLGFEATSVDHIHSKLKDGGIHFIYMLEDNLLLKGIADVLGNATVVAHATNYTDALNEVDVVLPAAMEIEAESTFINEDSVAQVTRMAKQITRMTPEMWMRIPKSRLDKAAVAVDNWRNLDNIYDVLPGWRLIARVSKIAGYELAYKTHKDIFGKMKAVVPELRDINVSYKVPKEAFKVTQYDFAIR
ncbi:MAG TPA: 2Fe-2S iron-sulfur cluster binding domain-containing protein, partial [Bacteroidetes bacterium]|nr:2Fe-2S iron-sulfur cluster binding domain-containing protein [Bacteroidota bacterium]